MHSNIKLSEQDYTNLAGKDWPRYENYINNNNVPEFVNNEINSYLEGKNSARNDAFCVLPFYAIEYPALVQCCLMEPLNNNDELDQIKKQMLSGVKSNKCSACWQLENNGLVSDRILKNDLLNFILDKNISVLEADCKQNNNSILHYKIDTNNVCNATCVTCSGESSNSWIKLEAKNNVFKNKQWNIRSSSIDIDYKNARVVNFRGGEPLLSSTNFEILENLLLNNNLDCFISFTTNGSIKLSNKQWSIISKFKKVNFCYSIDGIGPVFEYLRFPIKWQNLLDNLAQTRQHQNCDVGVSYTLSNLNILYHTQTINWFKKHNLPYLINPVKNPNYFSPSNLPLSIKEAIADENSKSFLKTNENFDKLLFSKFIDEICKQDKWKNINMENYLPELSTLLANYQ